MRLRKTNPGDLPQLKALWALGFGDTEQEIEAFFAISYPTATGFCAEKDGKVITITADFRKYACIEDSIEDHSAYLLNAKNGNAYRYAGLKNATDYKTAAHIIKDGGYATSSTYVQKLCDIIEKYNLTRFNATTSAGTSASDTTTQGTNTLPAVPFCVHVLINDLNIRDGASMRANTKGHTGKGTFTIVEVRDGWGKLKSGAGWISLDYALKA